MFFNWCLVIAANTIGHKKRSKFWVNDLTHALHGVRPCRRRTCGRKLRRNVGNQHRCGSHLEATHNFCMILVVFKSIDHLFLGLCLYRSMLIHTCDMGVSRMIWHQFSINLCIYGLYIFWTIRHHAVFCWEWFVSQVAKTRKICHFIPHATVLFPSYLQSQYIQSCI
jgi:hypothetical protein